MRATHNRARIAARVDPANLRPRPSVLAPSTPAPSGFVARRTRASMTGAQRNSEGRRSEWSLSQNNRDGRDPRWDSTVSSVG